MDITHRGMPSSNIIDDKMNCNERDKTDFFTGFSVTVISYLAGSSFMYSDSSRDPTAMTFRLPEGETLGRTEKNNIKDLKFSRLKNDTLGARLSKATETFRARKAIAESRTL